MKTESSSEPEQRAKAHVELIPKDWEVPSEFRQRLGDQVGRQRSMVSDGHLLLILHEPPHSDENTRDGRLYWRKPDGDWKSHDTTGQTKSLEEHLDQYRTRIDELETREENASSADEYFEVLSELTALHRAARNQHAAGQEAREQIGTRDLINLRDRTYSIERLSELLLSDAKNALDLTIARQAEEQAETSRHMAVSAHRLNVLAAFFFPIATLSAIFGVNLKSNLEELHPPWLFLLTILGGLLIGGLLKLMVTRKPT